MQKHPFFERIGGLRAWVGRYKGYLAPLWLAVVWLAGTSLLSLWFEGRDRLERLGVGASAPSGDLALVALDEVFGEHYDFPRETPKAYLADVVRAVAAHEPRVVMLDYWFTNADLGDPGLEALRRAIAEAPPRVRFVLPTRLLARSDGLALLDVPPAPLRRHVLTGYADLWGAPVLDARLTRGLGGGETAPSFALAALAAWTFPDTLARAQAVALDTAGGPPLDAWEAASDLLGGWDGVLAAHGLSPDDGADYAVNFRDHFTPRDRAVLPSETLLHGGLPSAFLDARLRDKLVVVGSTYRLRDDTFETPFGTRRGVIVHANILHSLLAEAPLRATGWGWALALGLLAAVGAVFLLVRLPTARAVAAVAGVAAAYLALHFGLFVSADLLLPLVTPLVAGVAGLVLAPSWPGLLARLRRRPAGPARALTLRLAPAAAGHRVSAGGGPDAPASLDPDAPLGDATLGDALDRVRRGTAPAALRHEAGAAVFDALAPGPVGALLRELLGADAPLRLGLDVRDPALDGVPWALARAGDGPALAERPDVTVVRLSDNARPPTPAAGDEPPAVVVAGPADAYARRRVAAALRGSGLRSRGAGGATADALPDLLGREPTVLHLVARPAPDGAALDLGAAGALSPDRLAAELAAVPTLSALSLDVVAPPGPSPELAALARRLTAAAPLVVAVPGGVPDEARRAFWGAYYAALAGGPPEAAFRAARLALAAAHPSAAALPTLWAGAPEPPADATD